MKLIDDLREDAKAASSLFAAQLLKEDVARLVKLEDLALRETDRAHYRKLAMTLSWTPGDLRTFELDPELSAFVDTVFARCAAPATADDAAVAIAWAAFNKRRMDLLVGCLSRPRLD